MGGHARDRDPGLGRRRERTSLVDVVGKPRQHVETGRRADRPHGWQVPFERPQERVAALAIDRPHPAEMVVELAALDEVRERQLVDGGRSPGRRSSWRW